ncbi:ESPR-type extended signal peptide-containing protein, partial [Gallibacterium anatis]
MNKIYKTKYSVAKKEIVVVSELTASHGKETSSVGQNNKKINFSTKLSMITLAILSMGLLSSSFVVAQTLIMKNGSIYAQEKNYFDNYNERKFVALNPAKNNETSNPGAVGFYSVAIGNDAEAQYNNAVVIGYSSKAFDREATVVGSNSGAGAQATALGANVYAVGYSSIAIGSDDPILNEAAKGVYGVQLPKNTLHNIFSDLWTGNTKYFDNQAKFDESYWDNEKYKYSPTYAKKLGAIAIGTRTIAGGEVSTSIGTLSFALADRSTAMGIKAYVDTAATGGTAIGENSRIFAPNSVAIGNKTEATSQGAMAYGYQAYAVGKNSIAIGSQVAASGAFYTHNTTSLLPAYANLSNTATKKNGDDVTVNLDAYAKFDTDTNSLYTGGMPLWRDGDVYLTIGNEQIQKTKIADNDNSSNSIVIGGRSYAVKKNSLAIGYSTLADSDNSFAIGSYTYVKASSNNSIAVGVGSYVSGQDSFLAGTQSKTESQRTVVLGPFSTIGSNSNRSMTFGYLSSVGVNSPRSIAFGALASVSDSASNSMALGSGAHIEATGDTIDSALAIGVGAKVKKGSKTKETGNNAMALGAGSIATLENSVALGVNSKTDYKYEDLEKDPWVAKGATSVPTSGKTGVISVGATGAERRITNVASGRLDTDAVNVAQLKTIDEKFDIAIESLTNGGGMQYLSVEHGNSLGEAGKIAAKIKLGENYAKYVNLKKTLKYIEARQSLNSENFNVDSVNKLKTTLQELQKESIAAGLNGGYESLTTDLNKVTTNTGDFQTVMDTITAAAEKDSNRSVNGLTPDQIVALKQNNNYLNDGAKGIDSIAFGFKAKTSGDENGDKGKHAIAIGYEAEANGENAIAIGNLAKALANNALSIGNSNKVSGADSGALGNQSYVSGTGTYVVGNGNDNGKEAKQISATNSGFFGNGNQSSAVDGVRIIGNSNTISASNVMVFGNNITASVANSVYLGDGATVVVDASTSTAGTSSYTKYNSNDKTISDLFANYTFAGVGRTADGAVSVGLAGKERRIQNVAAGLISATSTDAINGSQLYATNDLLGKLATTKIKLSGNKNSTTETQLYSPTAPLNFDIKGDENDLTSEASGKAISFSLLKEDSILETNKTSSKTATTKAIYDAIVGAKTTVTQTPNSPYLTVTPATGTNGLTANAYSIAFDYDALKRDLTGGLPFAKSDASNLSSDNITAWKNTLGLNNLSPNIGYRAGESTERKTVQASTGLTFVSKDENKLKITAKDEGIIEFSPQDYAYTKSEVDQKLNDLTSTLNIAGDGTSQGSVKLKSEVLGVKGTDKQIITKAEGQNITVSLAKEVTDKITKIDDKLDKSDLTNEKISGTLTKGNVVDSNTVSVTGIGANRLLGSGDLSFDVKDGSITSAKLADKAVTSDKIADGAVTADKLGDIKLKYTANNVTPPKEISLKNGSLKFTDGDNTTASVEDDGVVKYSVKTAELTHDSTKGVSVKDGNSKTYFATAGNVAEMFEKTSESLANKGLDFSGSLSLNGLNKIHRNLGSEVKIIGAKTADDGLGGIADYSAKNLATLVDATNDTIQIAIKKTPEFEGILLKGQDGTNSKDGFIGVNQNGDVVIKNGIDGKNGADTTGSKVVTEDSLNATAKLAYKANSQGYNGQENPSVSLTQGLNFTNGSNTTAEIAADGVVKYNVNTATLENNSTTGKVSVKNTDNGTNFATAKNVADTINTALDKVSSLNLVADTGAKGKVELPTQSLGIKGTKDFITTSVTADGNDITIDLDKKLKDRLQTIETTAGNSANQSLGNLSQDGKNAVKDLAIEAIDVQAAKDSGLSVSTNSDAATTHKKTFTVDLAKTTFGKADDGTVTAHEKGNTFVTAENIATAINEASKGVVDKGLKFKGDDNQTITKALGNELTIKGGKTNLTELTSGNIGVVSEDESLVVKLAKDLKDLNSISTDTLLAKTSVKVPSIVLGLEDGAPTLTGSLSEGKKLITINEARITGLEKGISDKDAVNYSQLSPIAEAIGATIDQSGSVTGPIFSTAINGAKTPPISLKDAVDQITTALNNGWEIQSNAGERVDSVTAGNKVKFANGTGTTSSVTKTTADGADTTTVKFDIVTSNLTFNEENSKTEADNSDTAFATASNVAKVINDAFAKATENVASGYADKNLSNITDAGKKVVTSLVTANGNDDVSVTTTGGENGVAKNFAVSLNKVKEVTNNEEKVVTSGAVYTAITGAKTTVNANTESSSNDYLTVSGSKTDDLNGNTFTVGLTKRATDALKVIEAALTPSDKDRTTPDGLLNSDLSNISDKGKETVKDLAIEAIDVTAKEDSGLSVTSNTNTDETHKKTFTIDLAKATLSKKDDGTVEADKKGNTFATAENVASTINSISTELTNKGLTFKGDSDTKIAKKLGDTVTVKGGVTDTNNLTENNIGVVADNDQNLVIKLAKELNGLTSVAAETLMASNSVKTPKVILGTEENAPTLTGIAGEDGKRAIDIAGAKITKVEKGTENDDAVNVGQLKDLGIAPDKAVVTYDDLSKTSISLGQKGANGETAQPVVINNVASGLGLDGRDADGNGSTTAPEAISPKKANEAVATLLNTKGEALNKVANVGDLQAVAQAGLDFIGNEGNKVHRALGTTLSIKGDGNKAADFASAKGNLNVVNLNDELTIQLAKSLVNMTSFTTDKTPDGKQVALDASGLTTSIETNGKTVKSALGADRLTFNDGEADSVTIDGVNKSITGLAKRDINSKDYGTSGNETRAATEGAVKGLADAIGIGSSNTNILPIDGQNGASGKDGLNGTSILDKVQALRDGTAGNMVYTDQEGNRLVQLADGFYKLDDVVVGDDGHYRPKEGTKAVETDNILISAVDANGETTSPTQLANVKSGLGLNPQALNVDAAQKVIAGDSKDGQGGLLTASGAALNKVATVGDLQALAQAGLDFVGNDEKVVHRPLGTKLSITGEGVDKNASQTFSSASGNINVVNNIDNTLTIQLAKALTNISSIGGSEGQGKISFDKGAVNFNDNVITGIKSAVSGPTEGKDYLDALANADNSSAVNVSDLKNVTEALGNKLTDAGLSFAGDSGNNVTRKLSEILSIKGGVTDVNKLTDNNIGVVADGSSSLNVKLSSELKDMTSFETAANADGTSTKLDADGIKVTGQDGKSAEYGLDGSTIANKEGSATYGANDVTFKDANNKELIKLDAANNAIVVNGKDGKDGITING